MKKSTLGLLLVGLVGLLLVSHIHVTMARASNAETDVVASITVTIPTLGKSYKIGDAVPVVWKRLRYVRGIADIPLMGERGTVSRALSVDIGEYVLTTGHDIPVANYRIVVQTPKNPLYVYNTDDYAFTLSAKMRPLIPKNIRIYSPQGTGLVIEFDLSGAVMDHLYGFEDRTNMIWLDMCILHNKKAGLRKNQLFGIPRL